MNKKDILLYFSTFLSIYPPSIIENDSNLYNLDIVLKVLVCFIWIIWMIKFINIRKYVVNKNDIIFFLFLVCIFISNIINNEFAKICFYIVKILIIYFSVNVLLHNKKIKNYIHLLKIYLFIIIFGNIISFFVFPNGIVEAWVVGWQPLWVLGNPNSFIFPFLFAIYISILDDFISLNRVSKITYILFAMEIFSLVYENYSTTGKLAITILFFLIVFKNKYFISIIKRFIYYIVFIVGLFFLFIILSDGSFIILPFINILGESASYLARVSIWKQTINDIIISPLIGFGCKTMEFYDFTRVSGIAFSSHNNYLQLALYCGLPALILFIILLVNSLGIIKYYKKNDCYFYLSIITFVFMIVFMVEQNPFFIGVYFIIIISIKIKDISKILFINREV